MNKVEQTYIDRSDWQPVGEWVNEPDRVIWVDEKTGYDCLIRRNCAGAWCGYVAVPKTHPYFGAYYDDVPNIEVHGGLTYAEECDGNPERGICHLTADEDKAYWLGFDCNHAWDSVPFKHIYIDRSDTYRTQEYVTNETLNLAQQLKDLEKKNEGK